MRQVLRAGTLGRPRGMGWRGRREGGSRWGTHVNPWLIHVNVWQKPRKYCKVISLQLIKINGKKKNLASLILYWKIFFIKSIFQIQWVYHFLKFLNFSTLFSNMVNNDRYNSPYRVLGRPQNFNPIEGS